MHTWEGCCRNCGSDRVCQPRHDTVRLRDDLSMNHRRLQVALGILQQKPPW